MNTNDAQVTANTASDFDTLLRANLARIFNERDAARRTAAAQEIFADDAVMYEPAGVVEGRDAITAVAGALLEQFGADFSFQADGVGVGHHGMGTLRWRAGPAAGPVMISGTDLAEVSEGRITRLWVLIDPAPASAQA